MKIQSFVINLDSATDRWIFQQKQLKQLNIPYQRVSACKVDDLSNVEYERWANRWQRKLYKTEVACFLSHYQIWKNIVKMNLPALILEDDALLSDKTASLLSQLETLEQLPFEHLTLETRGRKKLIVKHEAHTIFVHDNNIGLHKLLLDKTGACAYILTPIGAKKLLKRVKSKGAGLADALLCERPFQLNSMQTIPALAIQMDMAEYYGLSLSHLQRASSSTIGNIKSNRPKANNILDTIGFKYRRLYAQVSMGLTQLAYRKEQYTEIMLDNEGLNYLQD